MDKNESFLETQDRKKISYFERSEAEGDMNKIMRNIKRSNTNSSTSKISSRLLDLMEKVKKENNKK